VEGDARSDRMQKLHIYHNLGALLAEGARCHGLLGPC
jgi:hypothetical protein